MQFQSLLIKDTTRKQREEIVRRSLSCTGDGCENCSACSMGAGSTWGMYQDYIDGKREIAEINMAYRLRLVRG